MLEKVLSNLDVGLPGATLRLVLGAALALMLGRLPGVGSGRAVVALLLMLFAVKSCAAVGRRLVPASPAVRSQWERRRDLARQHDSFQWRKLVWYGFGILAVAASAETRAPWMAPVGVACVGAGAIAELLWRRKGLPTTLPVRG